MSSKGRPYRTVMVEGFEILVGRNALTNDELSLKIAEPQDEWLHAGGGVAGSHVVIRKAEEQPLPRSVLLQAGQLAAWFSKARGQRRVEVHHCRARDVTKSRGAPAGEVQIRNFKKIFVEPCAIKSDSAERESPK